MKKILIILGVVLVAWLVKLSYDVIQFSQLQSQLQQNLHRVQQENANLNDRLVALQRDKDQSATPQVTESITQIDPLLFIQQHLDLVEFSLKQQQYAYALEKISLLDADLKKIDLADSLKAALSAAILTDRQTIQKFVNARQAQQQQLNQVLQQLDTVLAGEIKQPNLTANPTEQSRFWQKWLQIESVKQPSQLLMQRQFVLKEAQLHILLARQLLLQGQYLAYQQEMSVVVKILQQLPDQKTKQVVQQLEKAKALTNLSIPVLSTRALLR